MTSEMERLYYTAVAADQAWFRELTRVFGKRAGNARYDTRGISTAELEVLHQTFRAATGAWLDAVRRHRDRSVV